MQKIDLSNIVGGWGTAPNGTYWLTLEEAAVLREYGFTVSMIPILNWEDVNYIWVFKSEKTNCVFYTHCVNNSNGKRAVYDEIRHIIGLGLY